MAELIRQAFLRRISTRQVGQGVAVLTGEPVSPQTVSRLTRVLDQAVQAFPHAPLDDDWAGARRAFERFRFRWRSRYPAMVRRRERDLPELLHFHRFRRHLWRKLRTTNAIERCFVEVRRRTRPMVVFTNVQSVDRIIYAIFQRFNED